MNIKTRAIAITLATGCMVSLSGCGTTIFSEDATKYPLVPALTVSEVTDYYAKALEFDSIVSRNIKVDSTAYETIEITDEDKITELKDIVSKAEDMLSLSSYNYSDANDKILDEENYHYIKSYLNDRELKNGKITKTSQAMGYYFIDVEYDIGARDVGTLKGAASLLGINGAFIHSDYYNTDSIDTAYLSQAINKLNNYYKENKIDKVVNFDASSGAISVTNSGETEVIDISEFHSIVGSSISNTAYMPSLDTIFNLPGDSSNVSGIGIVAVGENGLKNFGFDRSQISGKTTLRYVYKDSINSTGLTNTNIYVVESQVESGVSTASDTLVPEFVSNELDKLIERADRAIVNNDLCALMSGDIFSNTGYGVLFGYTSDHVNVLRQISTVRRVISRDIDNGEYLIEVESQRQEGPKGADVYGTYRDKSYVSVKQVGQEFIITDWVVMSRQIESEPDIDPDSAVAKRLVALNLAGDVSESAKEGAEKLLSDLYTASNYRILNGPKEITTSDGVKTLEKGMYDCFNSDVAMLSSSKKEDINSTLRGLLIKHGSNISSQISGIVTEWIGGADNQIEFITEEVITYQGRTDGVYMECYYLISKMADEWVIDDIQIISQEEISGDQLQTTIDRIRG